MKTRIEAPSALYTFLSFCDEVSLEKEILDCGAGGPSPPLALFHEHGYRTHGIEICPKQLAKAEEWCRTHGVSLDIALGDMRELPFAEETMSFVYSYASICHMTKRDVAVAMREITRTLKDGGLCFVSFCAAHDGLFGEDEPEAPGEYPSEDEKGVHSIFENNEPDVFFQDYTLLQKEKRIIRPFPGDKHGWAELLYFAKKC